MESIKLQINELEKIFNSKDTNSEKNSNGFYVTTEDCSKEGKLMKKATSSSKAALNTVTHFQ